MLIEVLYFAALRDRLARERDTVELPAETTAEAVLAELARLRPAGAELFARARLAIDLAFVSGPVRLTERSEVAVIPPVSGG
jgi:molybdopterin synthase sulfur carrier subunit